MRFALRFIVVFLPLLRLEAQDSPKEFYPKDFVQGQVPAAESPAGISDTSPARGLTGPADERPRHAPSSQELGAPTPVETRAAPLEEGAGYPVISIGAVINSKDQKHYLASLEELWTVASRYDFDVGRIYTIGDIEHIKGNPITFKLLARGARIAVLNTLPVYPKLEHSPAWIVSIEQGDVVLDGVGDLAGYFTAKGEFKARYRAGVSVVSEEEPTEDETEEVAP